MAKRSQVRLWNLSRNAVTLLLLGLIGTQLTVVLGISQVTTGLPSFLQVILQGFGLLSLGMGLMLFIGGFQRRKVRDWVVGLDELMISGPFRYVRRPLYSGVLLMLLGAGLFLNILSLLITAFLWAVTAILFSRVDDRVLVRRMGVAYKRYCRCTPLLVPHIGRIVVDLFRTE
jgi:protein-S-isoprenylcysteine O-methyltransferase Ste14